LIGGTRIFEEIVKIDLDDPVADFELDLCRDRILFGCPIGNRVEHHEPSVRGGTDGKRQKAAKKESGRDPENHGNSLEK
jgi:hypothetical protein